MSKSAFVAVVGRPSAGKSTLVNALCGHKVSIVSPVPQTTRNAIRGILSGESGQLVFVDTPGFHNSERKFNAKLTGLVKGSLDDCDLVLYLVDSSRPLGEEEAALMAMVRQSGKPCLAVLNKADLTGALPRAEGAGKPPADAAANARALRAALEAELPAAARHEISALSGQGLDALKAELFARAPEGHEWYPPEYYTDQDPDFRIAEIVREQVMNRTYDEIPHSSYVELEDLELRRPDGSPILPEDNYDVGAAWELPLSQKPRLNVRATVFVERDSQKGIVVGKGGANVKLIREAAEKEIRELFPYYVTLELRVKLAPKWRSDDGLIGRLVH